MAYQRGRGSVEVELANLQSAVEDAVPRISRLEANVDDLQSDRDSLKGSLRVIIWMNGIMLSLLIALIIALFSWGLNHLSMHAALTEATPQDAAIPVRP